MCIKCNSCGEQSKELDKARRYLDLLDTARCNGNWQDVPELARKVEKHAPQRKCVLSFHYISQVTSQLNDLPSYPCYFR